MYTHKKINKHESWLWLEDIPLQMCTAVDGMRNAGKEQEDEMWVEQSLK